MATKRKSGSNTRRTVKVSPVVKAMAEAAESKAAFGANYSMPGSSSLEDIIPMMFQAWGAFGYQPSQTWYQLATMYVSWVYTAIEKKARTLATLPPKLYMYEKIATGKAMKPWQVKATLNMRTLYTPHETIHSSLKAMGVRRVEVDDHPFLELCNRPNPDMVRMNFWHLLGIHLELNGAVGIYKTNYFLGHPTAMYILPTTWTGQLKPVPGPMGIIGYKLMDQNLMQEFTTDEIIWPHYPSLRNPFEGMSAIKAQLYTFNMDQYLQQQMIAFFKNNSMFANFFKTKNNEPVTPKVYNDLMAQLQNYQGPRAAFQPFLLNGLEIEKSVNVSARDAMIDEIEKFTRDKMLAAYDVSAGKVGLVETQNRSNLEAVNMNFFTESIKPLAMLIAEYFNAKCVHEFDDRLDFEFDYPAFVEREIDIRERESNLNTGTTTINEERAKMGLEADPTLEGVRFIGKGMMAIKDGKIVPEMTSQPPSPFGPSPATAPSAPSSAPSPKPKEPEGNDEAGAQEMRDQQDGTDEGKEGKSGAAPETKGFWTEEKKALAWKKFDKNVTPFEKQFLDKMQSFFSWVQKESIARLEKHGVKIKSNTAAMSRKNKARYLAEHKEKLDELMPSKKEMKDWLKKNLRSVYEETMTGAGENRAEEFSGTKTRKAGPSFDFEFDVTDPIVKEWLGTRLELFSDSVSTTTIDKTKATLREGYEDGESLTKIAERLRDEFEGGDTYRADLIARTETTSAYNQGDLESVRQMGLDNIVGKIWLAEPDARETHAQAASDYKDGTDPEGGIMTIDKMFKVGTDQMDAPANGTVAAENVNCFVPETKAYIPDVKKLFRSRFKGEVITVETRNGHKFTCTPNHPILTSMGWVAAGLLQSGDDVISTSRGDWMGLRYFDVDHRPSVFQEIYDAAAKVMSSVRVIRAYVNFYGDIPDSNVDVIDVNSKLLGDVKPVISNYSSDLVLSNTDNGKSLLFANGLKDCRSNEEVSRPVPDGKIRGGDETLSISKTCLLHSDEHGVAYPSGDNPPLVEAMGDNAPADAELSRDCQDGDSAIKQVDNLPAIDHGSSGSNVVIGSEPVGIEAGIQRMLVDPVFLRDLGNRLSVSVFLDQVLNIHRSSYDGFVYTAETHKGIYIAEGVVVKNCRCSLVYEVFDKDIAI